MIRPMPASATEGWEKSPRPLKFSATSLALTRAVRMMNRPRPALMPILMSLGISFTISSRTPKILSSRKTVPEMKTIPRPTCQDAMPARTIELARTALDPMPGASAKGMLETRPMTMVTRPDTRAVASSTPTASMPASPMYFG